MKIGIRIFWGILAILVLVCVIGPSTKSSEVVKEKSQLSHASIPVGRETSLYTTALSYFLEAEESSRNGIDGFQYFSTMRLGSCLGDIESYSSYLYRHRYSMPQSQSEHRFLRRFVRICDFQYMKLGWHYYFDSAFQRKVEKKRKWNVSMAIEPVMFTDIGTLDATINIGFDY